MATLTLKLDQLGLNDALANLGKNAIRAEVRALNRSIGSTLTFAARTLAEDTRLPVTTVKKYLRTIKATFAYPEATLVATGLRLTLYEWTRQNRSRGAPGQGVNIPGAFIATMKSGHHGIFVRKKPTLSRAGKPRGSPGLKIRELWGASIPHVFTQDAIAGALKTFAVTELQKNLRHEVRFLESKQQSLPL